MTAPEWPEVLYATVPLVNMEDPEIVRLAARHDASMRAVEEVCDSLGAAVRTFRGDFNGVISRSLEKTDERLGPVTEAAWRKLGEFQDPINLYKIRTTPPYRTTEDSDSVKDVVSKEEHAFPCGSAKGFC